MKTYEKFITESKNSKLGNLVISHKKFKQIDISNLPKPIFLYDTIEEVQELVVPNIKDYIVTDPPQFTLNGNVLASQIEEYISNFYFYYNINELGTYESYIFKYNNNVEVEKQIDDNLMLKFTCNMPYIKFTTGNKDYQGQIWYWCDFSNDYRSSYFYVDKKIFNKMVMKKIVETPQLLSTNFVIKMLRTNLELENMIKKFHPDLIDASKWGLL